MKTQKNKIINYILIILCISVVAGLGSLFVNLGMDWFSTLEIPSQFPPNYIIPIVWTTIYIVFAIVLCVWVSKEGMLPTNIIILLILNGIFNILWCLLFFTLQQTLGGLISIILLLILAYILVVNIYKYNNVYSYFTLIYPVWVSIATSLNLALWILN